VCGNPVYISWNLSTSQKVVPFSYGWGGVCTQSGKCYKVKPLAARAGTPLLPGTPPGSKLWSGATKGDVVSDACCAPDAYLNIVTPKIPAMKEELPQIVGLGTMIETPTIDCSKLPYSPTYMRADPKIGTFVS
jgi:hypothetical protein